MTWILARSYLYAPGNRGELLAKVFDAGADAVILDLEDSVPQSDKERARAMVAECLAKRAAGAHPAVWVRIGALAGDEWRFDVEAVVGPALTGLRIPKTESAAALERLEEAVATAEQRAGMTTGSVALTATVESAVGMSAVSDWASCRRLGQIAFGAADFLADIGADPAASEEVEAWARPQLVVASRAAGLEPPIAPVWTRLADPVGLRRSTRAYRRAGFFGRSLIHPRQIEIVHREFTPSSEEVERARGLLATYEDAAREGRGALRSDADELVDAAVVRRARAVVELAESLAGARGKGRTA